MCVFNSEDHFNGIKESSFRCGNCDECCQEHKDKVNEYKKGTTSCGNCGWCSECCE